MFWTAVIGISCLKLLLKPAYRSTDFEVHRNWLAITHSLPIEKWYQDETSQWTLDYPPLFAWFEFLLSQIAYYFDSAMLDVKNLNYASDNTILFQRLSVVLTDVVFAYGCKLCCDEVCKVTKCKMSMSLFLLVFGNAGLFIIDHIHFQYNGFLYGILFISIARMIQGREIESALWFTILLNLKHIYLYVAPAYFIYLLRSYCFSSTSDGNIKLLSFSIVKLIKLAFVVISVFGISFGPFIMNNQLLQVLQRLFPFKRGLTHAYWAPNFWALYVFADKVLHIGGVKAGVLPHTNATASMTGGLVQDFDQLFLPTIPPLVTFIATALSIMPALIKLWRVPHDPWQFVRCLILCAFGSFMFGWHVHEKAALLMILPMGLFCFVEERDAQLFTITSIIVNFSLFPLIFTPEETPIKVCALLIHAVYSSSLLNWYWFDENQNSSNLSIPLCSFIESLYLYGLVFLFLYKEIFHKAVGLEDKLPFLPLLMISVYCAVGISICWIKYYWAVLKIPYKRKRKND